MTTEDGMDEDEPTVIVCARVDDPTTNVVAGSVTSACGDCGALVWLAPSSINVLVEPGTEVICTRCFKVRLDAEPNEPVKIRRIRREQLDEIETWRKERKRRGPRLQDW